MLWDEAESTIRAWIEAQWALSSFSTMLLTWENETVLDNVDSFIFVDIQGNYVEKSLFSSAGKRLYVEGGIVFYHCFAPLGRGKQAALAPVVAMNQILELKTLENVIKIEGCNPPSPADPGDSLVPNIQPQGQYYRVTGSVPFILIGS